jgi:hypothetical protein
LPAPPGLSLSASAVGQGRTGQEGQFGDIGHDVGIDTVNDLQALLQTGRVRVSLNQKD